MNGVDLRAFRWPLLALERKLVWERDAARARLAQAVARVQVARAQLHAARMLCAAQARPPVASDHGALDPVNHRHLLRYLQRLQRHADLAGEAMRHREQTLVASRAACAACEHQLDALLAVRSAALRVHARAASLRQQRMDDAAWIVQHEARRAEAGRTP